jgi:hypothetical protein
MRKARQNLKKLTILPALLLVAGLMLPVISDAASLNQAGVRLGRLGITGSPDMLLTFKLNTTPTSVSRVNVVFPSGFTVTTGTPTPTGVTDSTNNPNTTAPPGTLTGAATAGTRNIMVSGLTSASLNSTALYGISIPAGSITNPGTAGQYNAIVCVGGASLGADCASNVIDQTTVPVYIFGTGSNADQINVTATVATNFSFQLSGTNCGSGACTDTLSLDSTAIGTSSGINMIVGTNSPLGYTAYVKSGAAQLASTARPGTPIANGTFGGGPDTVTAGSTKYGFVPSTGTACSSCSGSLTYDTEYNGLTGSQAGAFNGTNFASFAERNGYTNADTVSLKVRAAVANTVIASGDYTDTLTIVAAGNF